MSKIFRVFSKFLLSAVIIGFMAGIGSAAVTIPHTHHWNTISPWNSVGYGGGSLEESQGASGSSPSSLKFTYPGGFPNGKSPDKVWVNFPSQREAVDPVSFQILPNFYFHSVDNKQTYWYIENSSLSTNWYLSCSSGRKMRMVFQRSPGSGTRKIKYRV